MSIKKKLGMGIASGALAISLIGGGTFAYFSDTEVNNSEFVAGTLDIDVNDDKAIIDVEDLKPGDTITRDFTLENKGSLDVSKVLLTSDYTVTDADGNKAVEDLGKHIKVSFLVNKNKKTKVVHNETLASLSQKNVTEKDLLGWIFGGENNGLKAGDSDNLKVKFEFVDNNKDQNVFQGHSLELEWTFEAKQ